MHKLAEICVKRPVFATVLVLILAVFGIFGYTKLGVDLFPKVDFPVVMVTTALPGAAPEEVETEITDKIEEAVNTTSGIEELRSVSSEGMSMAVIVFKLEKDIDVASQEIRDRINRILPELPQDIHQPVVEKMDPDATAVLAIALSGPFPVREITEYADKVLRRQIEALPGVGQVMLVGGQQRQINVHLDPLKLRSQNLTISDVARALQTQNIQVPGGTVKEGARELTVRTLGRVTSMEELKYIAVANQRGHIVTIGDLGQVEDGAAEPVSAAQLNDSPAVLLKIRKQSGTNTVAVVDNIKERLATITKNIPPGYKIETVWDQSTFIRDSVNTVKEHLVIGSLLAAVVVFLFLSNARTTLISAFAIPTSIISTFAIMYMLGYTLNMLTLLALTLSVGIVIDDAIVVLENIFRYIEEKGYSPYRAAIAATREIGLAVLAITLSLVAVFLPIAFMEGISGRFMKSFGITMCSAIVISMLVSFSLTPMLASRWLRRPKNGGDAEEEEIKSLADFEHIRAHSTSKKRGFYHYVESAYLVTLKMALRYRWAVVLITVALLASIPFQAKIIRKNFLPDDDRSEFQMNVRAPEGMTMEATQQIVARIAREIRQLNGVRYTMATVADTEQHIPNLGGVYVRMTEMGERNFSQLAFMDYVRKNLLPKYNEENLRVSIEEVSSISSGMSNAAVQFIISGPDLRKLEQYSEKTVDHLKTLSGAVDVDSSLVVGKPQFGVTIDRAKAADLGVSVADIARTLRLLVAGDKVSDYNENGEQYEVHVRSAAEFRNSAEALTMVTVPSMSRGAVPLGDVVRFEEGTGPAQINRMNRARSVTITANLGPNTSLQAILDSLDETARDMSMGPDYRTALGGQSKELGKMQQAFLLVFVMAFIFVYLVIAAQFESWLHPITILLALPLTLPFALFSLLIFNQSLNILSMLGVLVLFAVVKKNAILQIDHTNQLRQGGLPRYDAMIIANLDRLRPILMTTVAFVAGMFPLLISNGTGAATNRTISSVVIGGQTLSLALTLLATPVAYSLFDDVAHARLWGWLFGKKEAEETPLVAEPVPEGESE